MKKRIYHLQDKDDVEMTGIEKKKLSIKREHEIVYHQRILLDVIQTLVLKNLLSEEYHVSVQRALNSLIYLGMLM